MEILYTLNFIITIFTQMCYRSALNLKFIKLFYRHVLHFPRYCRCSYHYEATISPVQKYIAISRFKTNPTFPNQLKFVKIVTGPTILASWFSKYNFTAYFMK